MTLKSAQDAPKMRQDGPDEPFGPFLSAKMPPQVAPKSKKNPPKKQSKVYLQKQHWKIALNRRTAQASVMQAPTGGPPTPSILASPCKIPLISLKYQASSSEVNLLRFRPYICISTYLYIYISIQLYSYISIYLRIYLSISICTKLRSITIVLISILVFFFYHGGLER